MPRHALTEAGRRLGRHRRDDGFAIVLVALLLVFFIVIAAIVIDLGNAREQKRQAVAAADAGALAGAEAVTNYTVPTVCTNSGMADLNCIAAFHTLASSNIQPTSLSRAKACTYHTVVTGTETCYRYKDVNTGRATVEVTNPYVFGSDPSKYGAYVNVRICWDAQTAFAPVIGSNSINVCGNATAYNSGTPGPGAPPALATDCSVEDNFEDSSVPPVQQLYVFDAGGWPTWGGTVNWANGTKKVQHDEDIVVVFDGHNDSELGFDNSVPPKPLIKWMAPTNQSGPTYPITAAGNEVLLPYISNADQDGPDDTTSGHVAAGTGYVLESLSPDNKVHQYNPSIYPAAAGNRTVIAYHLPSDANLKPNGQSYVYHSTLQAIDGDNVNDPISLAPTRCGEADWTFNHDGSFTTTCKEDSFFAYPPDPPGGQSIPAGTGQIKVYYTDESPIENWDSVGWPGNSGFAASPNFGIDFHYTLNGVTTQVPQYNAANSQVYTTDPPNPGAAYWLVKSDAAHTKDKFNTTIKWNLPDNLASGTYTIFVKAFDTDHPGGGDCGIVTWTATVKGTTGSVSLTE